MYHINMNLKKRKIVQTYRQELHSLYFKKQFLFRLVFIIKEGL